MGFVMAYNIGFGDRIWDLATFPKAYVYLTRAFVRDIELMPVYDLSPLFGALLILLFYVTLILVGASFIFAIVADSLYRAQNRPAKKSGDQLEPFQEFYRELKRRFP